LELECALGGSVPPGLVEDSDMTLIFSGFER
jgi:hypothetical protein